MKQNDSISIERGTDRKWHEAIQILDARDSFFVNCIEVLGLKLFGRIPFRRVPVDGPEVDGEQWIGRHVAAANHHWFRNAARKRHCDRRAETHHLFEAYDMENKSSSQDIEVLVMYSTVHLSWQTSQNVAIEYVKLVRFSTKSWRGRWVARGNPMAASSSRWTLSWMCFFSESSSRDQQSENIGLLDIGSNKSSTSPASCQTNRLKLQI